MNDFSLPEWHAAETLKGWVVRGQIRTPVETIRWERVVAASYAAAAERWARWPSSSWGDGSGLSRGIDYALLRTQEWALDGLDRRDLRVWQGGVLEGRERAKLSVWCGNRWASAEVEVRFGQMEPLFFVEAIMAYLEKRAKLVYHDAVRRGLPVEATMPGPVGSCGRRDGLVC